MAGHSRQFTPGGLPHNCETHCVSENWTHDLPIVSPTRLCHRDHWNSCGSINKTVSKTITKTEIELEVELLVQREPKLNWNENYSTITETELKLRLFWEVKYHCWIHAWNLPTDTSNAWNVCKRLTYIFWMCRNFLLFRERFWVLQKQLNRHVEFFFHWSNVDITIFSW